MANYDNNAFDQMNAGNDDMYTTGGAITMSEYEQTMSPQDQTRYEDALLENFRTAFNRDPYKRSLNFKHWLDTLNPELVRERALKWEDIQASPRGVEQLGNMEPTQVGLMEDAGLLQRLAHLHTGRIEDIIEIAQVVSQKAGSSSASGQQPQIAE